MTMLPFGQVAPVKRRAIAYLIDAVINGAVAIVPAGVVAGVAMAAGRDGMIPVLLFGGIAVWLVVMAWLVVYTLMQSRSGSIGMRTQGLRLVRADEGAPLGFWRALLRNVVFGLLSAIVVGLFTPLFDGSGRFQGWHDKAAGALMMDARVAAPEPEVVEAPPAPPAPPLLPAPSFDRLPPAPMPGFEPAPQAAPTADVSAPQHAAPAAPPRPAAPPIPVAEAGGMIAFVPGVTQDAPPQRAAAPAAPAAPIPPVPPLPAVAPAPAVPVPVTEDDDVEDTRISIPGHRLVFTWDDGTRVSVSRRTIFGRNPAPEADAVVVPVRDETLSLSKTHFEAAAEASGGWILDRHSTNGTVLVRDGQRFACPPGERMRVRLGDVIEIGDRVVTIGGYV